MNWDDNALKLYESGIDRATLYILNPANGLYEQGYAWYGMISVQKTPGGGEPTDLWANNAKYATMLSNETFAGTIEAYTYPPEFAQCDGTAVPLAGVNLKGQNRAIFGLAFRSRVGSADAGDESYHKIHVIYGCKAQPSEQNFTTINESPEATTFSWDFTSNPVPAQGVGFDYYPTAHIVFDTNKLTANALTWLEDSLWNTDEELLSPYDLYIGVSTA
jgi:hypothetical protein